jgi:hypothetical protein
MSFRTILIILFFTGIIFVVIEFAKNGKTCPKEKIIYRYVPRTFDEEQDEPAYPSDIFQAMFTQPTPWIGSINDVDLKRKDAINKYFISQI